MMYKSWIRTLRDQQTQLELVASWASIVQLGSVRDLCRSAKAELQKEIERAEYVDKIREINQTKASE